MLSLVYTINFASSELMFLYYVTSLKEIHEEKYFILPFSHFIYEKLFTPQFNVTLVNKYGIYTRRFMKKIYKEFQNNFFI